MLKTRTPGAIEKHVLKSAERIRREIARRMRRKVSDEVATIKKSLTVCRERRRLW